MGMGGKCKSHRAIEGERGEVNPLFSPDVALQPSPLWKNGDTHDGGMLYDIERVVESEQDSLIFLTTL
jgi:hypothetical protein